LQRAQVGFQNEHALLQGGEESFGGDHGRHLSNRIDRMSRVSLGDGSVLVLTQDATSVIRLRQPGLGRAG
jgi:hypothetical protein